MATTAPEMNFQIYLSQVQINKTSETLQKLNINIRGCFRTYCIVIVICALSVTYTIISMISTQIWYMSKVQDATLIHIWNSIPQYIRIPYSQTTKIDIKIKISTLIIQYTYKPYKQITMFSTFQRHQILDIIFLDWCGWLILFWGNRTSNNDKTVLCVGVIWEIEYFSDYSLPENIDIPTPFTRKRPHLVTMQCTAVRVKRCIGIKVVKDSINGTS